jgi:carbon-monoxide dehydrogenase medium subunit
MKPAPFAYVDPETIDEVVELLAEHGDDAKLLAGGQSLVPVLNFRLGRPALLIDINRVSDLQGIVQENGRLVIKAITRQAELERWVAQRPAWALLGRALSLIGHVAIRSRGTIGGSIAHADPAAELPAILLALDGEVVARSRSGERVIPASDLFIGPLTTILQSDELLAEVRLPTLPDGAGWSFIEVARRHGDFALVGVAATIICDDQGKVEKASLALFGAGDTPIRAAEAEGALVGEKPTLEAVKAAAAMVGSSLSPFDDLHATAEYRAHVAGVLAERALSQALQRCQKEETL